MFIPEGYVSVTLAIDDLSSAWFFDTDSPLSWAREALGEALANEKLHAFGIADSTGKLIHISPGYWRTSKAREFMEGSLDNQFLKNLEAYPDERVLPIIPKVTLQELFPEMNYSDATSPTVWPEGYKQQVADTSAPNAEPDSGSVVPSHNLGGRPSKFDWDAFWVEVARYVGRNGIDPDCRTACQQHMEDWTATKWKEAPQKSTIRSKLVKVFTAPITIKE
jgi:hypothetical protein